jgi:hypothetical protein
MFSRRLLVVASEKDMLRLYLFLPVPSNRAKFLKTTAALLLKLKLRRAFFML